MASTHSCCASRQCGVVTLLVIAMVMLLLPSGFGQVRPNAPRVTDVEVRGLRAVPLDDVLARIKLRVGSVVSARAVNEDIRRLDEMGTFDPLGINVRQEPYQDGVRLIYDLAELPVVTSLRFEGNRALKDKKLRSAIGFTEGDHLYTALSNISTTRILDVYHQEGHQFAEVTRTETADEAANTIALSFAVKEGPRTRLDKIKFQGNASFKARKLRSVMTTKPRWLLWGGVFDRRTLEADVENITQFYKMEGFLDAVVSTDLQYSWDKRKLTIAIDIIEGPQYTVRDVTLRGAEQFTGDALYATLKLRRGNAFTLRDYDMDLQALTDFFGERGYLDARVDRKQLFPEPGEIELLYDIREGEQIRLGRLELRGNDKTQDKVIRRQFTLYPGDVLDRTQMRRSLSRLQRLRYFTSVESSLAQGDEPGSRNVVVEVEEGPTGQIVFGAGVSSSAGLIGQLTLNLSNFDITDWPTGLDDIFSGNAFVGGGQTFLLQLRPGTDSSQARLFFSEPYLFDSSYSFSSDIFYYERDREDYDETRIGVKLAVGRHLTDALHLQLTARAEQVDIDSLGAGAPAQVVALAGTSDIMSLILSGDYNKTDSSLFPTRGYRLIGSVEVADDVLGSDFSFVKVIGEARCFKTVYTDRKGFKHILALRGRAGVCDRTSGRDIPFFERFYAGGRNSVRGFEFRGLGPHQGGDPIGGEWMAILNTEYTFPIIGDTLRGAVFADVGTVGADLDDLSEPFRAGVGFGIRIRPLQIQLPITLDWATAINAQDDDDEESFSFTIGTLF